MRDEGFFIAPENLQDKFLYDDTFVDYFNTFLQLKSFAAPVTVKYERLDGFYLDGVEPNDPTFQQVIDDHGKFLWQGGVLSWLKEHRLPFFLRSQLFLEFKLCKFLLHKLLDPGRGPQGCSDQGGYSKASSPYPLTPPWSSSPFGCLSQATWPVNRDVKHCNRPFGSACSLPAMLSMALETRMKLLEGPPSKKLSGTVTEEQNARCIGKHGLPKKETSVTSDKNETEKCRDVSVCTNQFEEMTNTEHISLEGDIFNGQKFISQSAMTRSAHSRIKKLEKQRRSALTPAFDGRRRTKARMVNSDTCRRRTRSAPAEGALSLKARSTLKNKHDILLDDFSELDFVSGEDDTILDFDEHDVDETDAELQTLADESKQTFQEMKEHALKSILGMKDFRDFLNGTAGIHLFNFWLDVEKYKDLEAVNTASLHALKMLRLKLFREINDKYRSHLTAEAKEMIKEALHHDGLTSDLFTRSQYDTLRRLRSYWIPRFLVHKEKTRSQRAIPCEISRESVGGTPLSFLPTLSIVHSLPPRGDWCVELARRSCDWSKNLPFTDARVRSPRKRISSTRDARNDYEIFLAGISSEREAGWPFRSFLERMGKKEELSNLLFWQSVEDLKREEARECDRHLHLCNAWTIVKQYLSDEAETAVNLNELDKQKIIEKLRTSLEVTSASFKSGQMHALTTLRTAWEEYKEEDQQTLSRCAKVSSFHRSSPGSKNGNRHGQFHHAVFTPGKWYPRYPESSPSERQRRLHTALTIAENIEATRLSLSPQKSQCSLKKQRSAEKTNAAKNDGGQDKPVVKFNQRKAKERVARVVGERTHGQDKDRDGRSAVEEAPALEFTDILNDKTKISSFKHFMQNTEGRHGTNNLEMFLEIEAYKAIPPSRKAERTQQATQIFKNYFDSSSRKNVGLPASIPYQVQNECPSSPTLLEAQKYVTADIQASFKQFYKSHWVAKQVTNTDPTQAKTLAKADTPITSSSFVAYYKRRRNKLKGPGRVQPTKEDKMSFVKALRDIDGELSPRLEHFKRYLDNNDDVQGDSVSKLENDLLFYLQVQKFKDLFCYMDDTTLLKKVDAIVDCFLDSATPPSVQIDISSDLASRIVQKAQSLHARTKTPREQRDAVIFDEAQNIVLKELLPFWAGYTRQHESLSAETETDHLPLTRRQLMIKRRYSAFKKYPGHKRPSSLRSVLPGIGESKRELNFSVAEGLAWKESFSEDGDSVSSVIIRGSTRSGTRDVSEASNSHLPKNSVVS